jgi:hypothetical protein
MKEAPKKETHDGSEAWVNPTTESLRREECLCLNCEKMNSCPAAKAFYGICVLADTALAVTRCPKFEPKK